MINGNLPNSDLYATLDDLLWTAKNRLQKSKWVFSIPELSHDQGSHAPWKSLNFRMKIKGLESLESPWILMLTL